MSTLRREFGTEDVVDALSEEADRVEQTGGDLVCYEDGEVAAEIGLQDSGGSIATVYNDESGDYRQALEDAVEGEEGVGYDDGQIKESHPIAP